MIQELIKQCFFVQGPLLRPNSGGNPWDFLANSGQLSSHDIQSSQKDHTVIGNL